jgi:hypothetical protein
MRLFKKDESLFNDKGVLTYFRHYGLPAFTNAKPEQIKLPDATPGLLNVEIVGEVERGFEGSTTDPNIAPRVDVNDALLVCGFLLEGFDAPKKGKFVFMKSGIFFIFHEGIPHIDVIKAIGCWDRVAVYSAGFIKITPEDADLYGKSESLDREPLRFERTDKEEISKHLGIPYTEDETI